MDEVYRGTALFCIVSCDQKVSVQSFDQQAKCGWGKWKSSTCTSLVAIAVVPLNKTLNLPTAPIELHIRPRLYKGQATPIKKSINADPIYIVEILHSHTLHHNLLHQVKFPKNNISTVDHIIFTTSHTPSLISMRHSQLMTDWWVVTHYKHKSTSLISLLYFPPCIFQRFSSFLINADRVTFTSPSNPFLLRPKYDFFWNTNYVAIKTMCVRSDVLVCITTEKKSASSY